MNKQDGDNMDLKDQYKYFVSAYYGVREMDEYDLKVYVLKDIENYIKDFIEVNPISNFDYRKTAMEIEKEVPLKTKLQDSLLVLNKINGPIELILLIKKRIKKLMK
jgi:hypothetical protein